MGENESNSITFDVIKDNYINCLQKVLVFNGRARRREFWLFVLVNAIVGLVLGWIPVLGWLVSTAVSLSSISVGFRRLHDTNRSGKRFLLLLIPCVGGIILAVGVIVSATMLSYAGVIWAVLIILFIISLIPTIFFPYMVHSGGNPRG